MTSMAAAFGMVPLAYGIGDDLRLLGAECTACRIVCARSRIELYPLS